MNGEDTPPTPPQTGSESAGTEKINRELYCVQCGYDVRGLQVTGVCPECGADVRLPLLGNRLIDARPTYLTSLSRGLLIVLCSVFAQIAISILMVASAVITTLQGGPGRVQIVQVIGTVTGVVAACIGIVNAFGWWMFSQPDPGYKGTDDGYRARRALRITIVVRAIVLLIAGANSLFLPSYRQGLIQGVSPQAIAMLISLTVGLASMVVWVAQFLSTMLYVRWLAERDEHMVIVDRCRLYIWLLPLIFIVGYACLGLGPLVVLFIYVAFLFQVKRMIDEARRDQAAGMAVN
ncbi:MAG: hypothetical protein KDA21_04485 [Phycisphaerales bacterium]|nr:hypothetical protein [Phycisphaerales bacterium]